MSMIPGHHEDSSGLRAGFFARMGAFMRIIFAPKLHIQFAAYWFLSLQGLMIALGSDSRTWHLGITTAMGVATLFVVMFYLRALDEVKDYEYDRKNNPDRPLVCGAVSFRDIVIYAVSCAGLVVLINIPMSDRLVMLLIMDMSYGLLLLALERLLPLMKRSMFFNLAITYPVSIALSFYTMLHTIEVLGVGWNPVFLHIIGVYILAFLHFELVRKTMWPHLAGKDERFYAHDIGGLPAIVLGFVIGVLAIAALLSLTQPWTLTGAAAVTGWLPCLALIWAVRSLRLALGNRERRINPRPFAVAYLATFYITNLVHALVSNSLAL